MGYFFRGNYVPSSLLDNIHLYHLISVSLFHPFEGQSSFHTYYTYKCVIIVIHSKSTHTVKFALLATCPSPWATHFGPFSFKVFVNMALKQPTKVWVIILNAIFITI